ncbi:hypothetical protein N7492_003287 [Penicillium capsulatum]|uniref:Uncharacterized protein n=1 Tax=Penicillium capsulatum TaxID=69766 RepID=A0A9W9ILL4_9EURO|nr:hypothetical protein N7492_003287 [Penicillium capsulatum]
MAKARTQKEPKNSKSHLKARQNFFKPVGELFAEHSHPAWCQEWRSTATVLHDGSHEVTLSEKAFDQFVKGIYIPDAWCLKEDTNPPSDPR